MKEFFDRLFRKPTTFVPPRPVPTTNRPAPTAAAELPGQFPATFDPDRPPSVADEVSQPRVFEPSLLNFRNAFRWGDPTFTDPAVSREWALARQRVMIHLLTRVAESAAAESLMLRGSLLLKLWLGEKARDPGDLDWIVDPPSAKLKDPGSAQLIEDVIVSCCAGCVAVGIDADTIVTEDIWAYERAPGRRILFPWRVPNLPGGTVQMDIVFGEPLIDRPVSHPFIPRGDAPPIRVKSASLEQSLAWKLMWLQSDMHPQAKDLYDATLLAEHCRLPFDRLLEMTAEWNNQRDFEFPPSAESLLDLVVDWNNFTLEYPHVSGNDIDWKRRLFLALSSPESISSTQF